MKVLCPVCQKEGVTSKVFDLGARKTLMGWEPYYDEQGVYHRHDPNVIDNAYRCSNKHTFYRKFYHKCCSEVCDYGSDIIEEGLL
jgi:hypothetical protein